jgi:hypothetical protein
LLRWLLCSTHTHNTNNKTLKIQATSSRTQNTPHTPQTTKTCSSHNDAQPGRINVLYHEAPGGKCVPRAVLFDIEPGVIGAVTVT